MIRQCCVCKKVHEGGRWVQPEPEHLEHEEITHSYCEKCREDFNRSVAEYFAMGRAGLALSTGL